MSTEVIIRIAAFFGLMVVFAAWEALAPKRERSHTRPIRWLNNLALVAINSGILRLVAFAGPLLLPITAALVAERQGWGVFNTIEIPYWLAVVLTVLILDLIIYAQHVAFHYIPPLWRLHRMHHTDTDIDFTTGIRFHPVEIVISQGIKIGAVIALGAPALGVLIFEVLLNATSLFNHANISLPRPLDRVLRLFVVTPDMHRVHHSVIMRETNSNFGFNLPWWDRLFRTYRAQPQKGHRGMTIGLDEFRDPKERWLTRLISQPFRNDEPSA